MSAKIILMADNDADFLNTRCEFLERAGYAVITAYNPRSAEQLLARGGVDLAILDIRMVDDNDEEDISGLLLARKFGQSVPVIMLTGYPTWENAKSALGRDLDGLSPAVDFVFKQEGPDKLIQTVVNLTLESPKLKKNVLHEFQAETSQQLLEAIEKVDPAETTDKFQKSLERTERDLVQYRKEKLQQSERAQTFAMYLGLVGIGVVLIGITLAFFKVIPLALASGAASVVAESISVLSIRRASQASKEVDKVYKELLEIFKANSLISACDKIETKSKRDDAKQMVIEKLASSWLGR